MDGWMGLKLGLVWIRGGVCVCVCVDKQTSDLDTQAGICPLQSMTALSALLFLPQVPVVHVAHVERLGGEGVRLHLHVGAGHLIDRLIGDWLGVGCACFIYTTIIP